MLKMWTMSKSTLFLILALASIHQTTGDISVSTQDITVLVNGDQIFDVEVNEYYNEPVTLHFYAEHDDLLRITPSQLVIPALSPTDNTSTIRSYPITIRGIQPGHLVVSTNSTPPNIVNLDNVFVRVTVQHSDALSLISVIVGWLYFVAWSVSFYPQIYINFDRKSVIGLNFDFLALNLVGFTLYSLFNIALFFNHDIQVEYFNRYPRGLNPVQINDVVFSLHAAVATIFTICQCLIYERGDQRVSRIGHGLLGLCAVLVVIAAIISGAAVLPWLDFLYICSYIKLGITLVKYVPQAIMNYRRKSTVGWSIGNIFLDLTGGLLSMLQMILNAYNYDDWASIFGDPTKFGLGFFSVIFDCFFIVQHYILYRGADKKINDDEKV